MTSSERQDVRLAIESVLFVAHGPVDIGTLARVAGITADEVEAVIDEIAADYKGRGLRVQRLEGAAQFVSAPEATPYVESYLGIDENETITPAALETLAIIAYKQPITRSTIERIRGVSCDYAVSILKARGLIAEVGRASSPGRPYLYGTTFRFLEHFGLEKPEDLPPLPELDGVAPHRDEVAAIESAVSGQTEVNAAEPDPPPGVNDDIEPEPAGGEEEVPADQDENDEPPW